MAALLLSSRLSSTCARRGVADLHHVDPGVNEVAGMDMPRAVKVDRDRLRGPGARSFRPINGSTRPPFVRKDTPKETKERKAAIRAGLEIKLYASKSGNLAIFTARRASVAT